MTDLYYLRKIKEDFSRRTRSNPAYSVRAYARYLGLHPSTLSQVMLGKRPLPKKLAPQVELKLGLGARESRLFHASLSPKKAAALPAADSRLVLDETYHQIIAEWEHYAALTLFDCEGPMPSIPQIADRLGIKLKRAEVVVENLIRFRLLIRDEKSCLTKAQANVKTTEDIFSRALQASHRESLRLAAEKITEIPIELRDFSSVMFAVDPEQMGAAKEMIRDFRRRMAALGEVGRRSEVYELSVQLYPLTKLEERYL
jgi:uncharacterized protein (TIGR02147 family)